MGEELIVSDDSLVATDVGKRLLEFTVDLEGVSMEARALLLSDPSEPWNDISPSGVEPGSASAIGQFMYDRLVAIADEMKREGLAHQKPE